MRWNPVWGYYNQREKKEWEIDFIVVVEISNGVGGRRRYARSTFQPKQRRPTLLTMTAPPPTEG